MLFGDIIRSFRTNNGLSQTNFVDVVQRSNFNFNNLDVVTLSRWERGVTTPHLKRQNELLDLLGVNIFEVWETNDATTILNGFKNKLNSNGYIDTNANFEVETTIINSMNSHLLGEFLNFINVIFEYEDNLIFVEMVELGLSRKSIIEKILNQYNGELTLVSVNGQLIGHLLSSNYSLFSDFIKQKQFPKNEKVNLVITFNCTHYLSFISTMGREAYKFIQSLNPNTKFFVLLKNKKMFDLFFLLGFEYRSIATDNNSMKVMHSDSKRMKSKRAWMDIIANYKGDDDE
ncbi:helix-turn-helix domain-containing protein [Vibrio apostichopi]|uniref:helix-turn-helix domain-containing protein n=1 Tax=Vibrio apostichopi TaxID=3035453 RepID=UPI0025729CD0|nr:helix-turn-helix transcriptional regulator [Vibrio sp. FE10]